ncbi:Predicted flavoprotein CzcO associated with the cation diffusion facilitator CzcD [Raineyella antarctica]|uniref:Predicted flavoprotein CzcO associated with the cation diffusion facilitator CzcD n=1 Tax=Raineyella antarctica TaxID=1577474 RepID=A0A1G6I528_9ACTN|nr:alpha/beta hydrolase fold domain-containing protein [Raineyella antarctica]SDC01550.1 Predicted flavoprotein CzcO associated with the cation diffusion facilitator CzcD [Raineyella antarctica]
MDTTQHDVIVIGAGFAGIYAIHKYRDQMGLDVVCFDAAEDVGGTWYWNRYPGARVDIESVHYSFSFDPELQQEWHWTEKFAAQPEILRYLNHCADRYDVRRSVRFGTRVVEVTWDEQNDHWRVTTDKGDVVTARYFVSGAGTLSVPKTPDFPGVEDFAGQTLLTGNWREDVDLAGKRVGIIGVGSSGIQAISEISKVADALYVFQRTPNYATPIANYPTDPAEEAADKARYAELREASRNHFLGVPYSDVQPSALAVSAEERREVFEDRFKKGGFRFFIDSFGDILFSQEANDTAAEYVRESIRKRVQDPRTADLLCPTDYPYGTKRPPLEIDYYEAYNRESTHLVDVKANPIQRVIPQGVRLADGTEVELDVLILATGFDACTGPLLAMNITGRGGVRLADEWADGPQTYLGLTMAGFPNLFAITGPQSPSVLYNMPLAIEDHVDFIGDSIQYMRERGLTVMEATAQAQDQWVYETNALADMTLLPDSASTWYMGANIPGKPRRVLVYVGGAPRYRSICDNVQRNDYRGFAFATSTAEVETATPSPALDPALAAIVEILRGQGFTGFEDAGVEGSRAAVESFTAMQAPRKEIGRVVDEAYGTDPEQKLRIFVPEGEGPFPVVVYVHGGGFVAGSIEVVDEPARDLASRAGVIVVAPTYRRAPEHRFPAAHDDAYAALEWTADNVAAYGGDPSRLGIGGDSAGGMLAAAAAIRARQEGPELSALLLVNPLVNPVADTPSRREYAEGYIIELADLQWFGSQYLNGPEEVTDPRLALDAADLAGLPQTLILTSEYDTLRDEAEDFATQLLGAGVETNVQRFDGMTHDAFLMSGAVPRCIEQRLAAADFLRSALVEGAQEPEVEVVTA